MENIKSLILIIIAVLFYSCTSSFDCARGVGIVEEFNLELSNFEDIIVTGDVDIVLTQGPDFETIFEGEPEVFEVLDIEVRSNTLILGVQSGECVSTVGANDTLCHCTCF